MTMRKAVLVVCVCLPFAMLAQKKPSVAKANSGTVSLKKSIADGQTVYQKFCLSCHQADGSGVPSLNPPLVQTKWILGPKAVLVQQVLNGSKNKVEIDGETFHNTMPPQGKGMTDEQIANVLTYVRNSFGNKASRVTPAEVKAIRAKTK